MKVVTMSFFQSSQAEPRKASIAADAKKNAAIKKRKDALSQSRLVRKVTYREAVKECNVRPMMQRQTARVFVVARDNISSGQPAYRDRQRTT